MYQALYRKWRPLTFDDVISQPHITTTLKNQIKNEKTAHAYLFTGSRGTGKTTCARIFAKAINCTEKVDSNPCLSCSICNDAENFSLSDIIEIDAASNNSVDDIRDLRDGTIYTPERCKYKIYIIDEVHMLSISAFNALLKIMEEPPSYVKFILATTEIHKVPATITSRCQRFDFRRILSDDIAKRLIFIAEKEDITLNTEAAFLIAQLSDGGMRDALSILDQCSAFSNTINIETVANAAGIADRTAIFEILQSINSYDISKALNIVSKLYEMSKDISKLCDDLIFQLRNLMLLKINPNESNLLMCLPSELEILKQISNSLSLEDILKKLSILQDCNDKLTFATNKRVEFEMCIINLSSKNNKTNISQISNIDFILEKLNNLEKNINSKTKDVVINQQKENLPEKEEPYVDMKKLNKADFKLVENWIDVLDEFNKINPAVSASLNNSKAYVNGNLILIVANNPFFITLFKNKSHASSLGDAIEKVIGKRYAIRAKNAESNSEEEKPALKLIEKAKNANIESHIEN